MKVAECLFPLWSGLVTSQRLHVHLLSPSGLNPKMFNLVSHSCSRVVSSSFEVCLRHVHGDSEQEEVRGFLLGGRGQKQEVITGHGENMVRECGVIFESSYYFCV